LHITDKNIVLFTGNYGSGKSEIAVNFAIYSAKQGLKVTIADLDIVNPYFRCREAREPLEKLGIRVAAPGGVYHSSELPIILPELRGLIAKPDGITILDVGGDNVGATVLASFADVFRKVDYEMFFVLNKNRPFTGTVEGAVRIMREVEEASKLKITAIAGNTHLIDETTPENIREGAVFAGEVSTAARINVAFIGVMEKYYSSVAEFNLPYPIIPMTRLLLPPWAMKSPGQMVTHARDRFGKLIS
jgi:hypothetical protein